MATVAPFRGLLYSTSHVSDLQAVIAPPYDVISHAKAEDLRNRDPHNIVHLDLPPGEAPAKYDRAARLLSEWQEQGILERDGRPAIYVTSQKYAVRGMPEKTRWGFLALLRIEDDEAGIVLPHEGTMSAPRRDRMELSAATRTQLSPIFVLYSDPSGEVSGAVEEIGKRPADRWVSDDAGVETRLWRVSEPAITRTLCERLAAHKIWIADGHHRYAAARQLRDRWREEDPSAPAGSRTYDYVMTYFSNVDSAGLSILPYHRVLRGQEEFSPARLLRDAEPYFDVKKFPFEGYDHRAERIRRRLHEVSDRRRLAIGVYCGGPEFSLLVLKQTEDASRILSSLSEPVRKLDVSVLHRIVLEEMMRISPEQQRDGGHLRFTEEVERALDWVDAGEAQAAFLLNPPVKSHLLEIASAGLRMPQKSTYFYPKVLTGLVMNPLEPFDAMEQSGGGALPSGPASV